MRGTSPFLAALALAARAGVGSARTNFVVFFADDLGYGDVGFNGTPARRDFCVVRAMRMTTRRRTVTMRCASEFNAPCA